MKTITLTDEQFEQLKEYVIDSCENIMDRSLEWADSDLSNEIIDYLNESDDFDPQTFDNLFDSIIAAKETYLP